MTRISLIIIAMLILLTGCLKVKYGSMPDTKAIQAHLTLYASTKADVLRVLGPPRGYGMTRLPAMPSPNVIWFYEYLESDGKNVDLKMLLVYFEGEMYSGHLWFSSFTKAEVIK
jgi:hypothetical protein